MLHLSGQYLVRYSRFWVLANWLFRVFHLSGHDFVICIFFDPGYFGLVISDVASDGSLCPEAFRTFLTREEDPR